MKKNNETRASESPALIALFLTIFTFCFALISCSDCQDEMTGSLTISVGGGNSRTILAWDTIDSSNLKHEVELTDSEGTVHTASIPAGTTAQASFTSLPLGSCTIKVEGIGPSSPTDVRAIGSLTTTINAGSTTRAAVLMGPPSGKLGISITCPIDSAVTLSPIKAGNYTEREATFTVEVSGVLNATDAASIGLSLTPANFSFSGNNVGGGNYSNGILTFNVTAEYDDGPVAISSVNITVSGFSQIPSGYSAYAGGSKSAGDNVPVIAGALSSNPIPITKANIAAFNRYVTDASSIKAKALTKHYKLTEDIVAGDLRGDLAGNNNWVAIGDSSDRFSGSFDGNGKTITGLKIDTSSRYQGLFGVMNQDANVKNLGLLGVNITSSSDSIGGITGYYGGAPGSGVIEKCYVTGTITGSSSNSEHVGGIVGQLANGVTIQNCYTSATVVGSCRVGGISGCNYSTIQDCYTLGDVRANDTGVLDTCIGGIVGANADIVSAGTVKNCYATGNITGWNFVGGIAGINDGLGTVQNCVALNINIIRLASSTSTDFGRVAGDDASSMSVSANKARSDMVVITSTVTDIDKNGTGLAINGTVPLSNVFSGWGIGWTIPNGNMVIGCNLPKLQGFSASQTTPTLP